MKHITLIITGSIAAPKALILLKQLQTTFLVDVICTKSALFFLENKDFVYQCKMFEQTLYDKNDVIKHTNLALKTDLIVVYPATMSFISKANCAIADSLALSIFLASTAPKIIFPAMNHNMYHHEQLQKHLIALTNQQNITIIPPDTGILACKMVGDGRLPTPTAAIKIINNNFKKSSSLSNKVVLINYGRTRTYLDPISYITNNSSGKMGHALARACLQTNAQVICVVGDSDILLQPHSQLTIIKANTNQTMLKAMTDNFSKADIIFCVAALNDYQVNNYTSTKISKTKQQNLTLLLAPNIDVLAQLGKNKQHQILIGFAAQDENHLSLGIAKMKNKNCDGICINSINVMGQDQTQINFYFQNQSYDLQGTKVQIAKSIVEIISKNI